MKFSKIEIKHLLIAWIAISLAFAIAFTGIQLSLKLLAALVISLFTVGIGFVFHELSHKYLAQKYHCLAEFRANYRMLLLAIVFSFFGFVFAAPGAVLISGHINLKQRGKISAAGPFMNLLIAFIFLIFFLIFKSLNIEILNTIFRYGILINSWLALFNLLPFGIMDGYKVLAWNKKYYSILIGASILIVICSYLI